MFKKRKNLYNKLEELQKEKQEVHNKLKEIEKEKQELIKIKEILEDQSPKIDITNVYEWKIGDISYIVEYSMKSISMRCKLSRGKLVSGFHSQLIDVFNNQIIYEKESLLDISQKEFVSDIEDYAYLTPIQNVDRSLLAYVDKKVPLYVLQQTYYKLNNIDVTKIKTLK